MPSRTPHADPLGRVPHPAGERTTPLTRSRSESAKEASADIEPEATVAISLAAVSPMLSKNEPCTAARTSGYAGEVLSATDCASVELSASRSESMMSIIAFCDL